MALTTPNSTVKLLKGVKLDSTYQNTIYFASTNDQFNYFNSKVKHTLTDYTYIRQNAGIRVELRPEQCFDCNYLIFQNTNFSPAKWFYAFITNVEYVDNGCCEISFELDVFQTWFVDGGSINYGYIERQHAMSDSKWEHKLPEPFPLGDTRYSDSVKYPSLGEQYVVIKSPKGVDKEGQPNKPHKLNGTFYTGTVHVVKNMTEFERVVKDMLALGDNNITSMQVIYSLFANRLTLGGGGIPTEVTNTEYVTYVPWETAFNHDTINGYKPRNNKCFNFPYYCCYVSNQAGLNATYDFAMFDDPNSVAWSLYSDICDGASIILHPVSYKGVNRFDYCIRCSDPPQVNYSTTPYNYYRLAEYQAKVNGTMGAINSVAQNVVAGSVMQTALSTGALTASGAFAPALAGLGMIGNAIDYSLNLSTLKAQEENTPPTQHNLTGNDNMMYNMGAHYPIVTKRYMVLDMIKKLDMFFDVYGYQSNIWGKPNINGRRYWNYVKMRSCSVTCNAPVQDNAKICQCLNNGITFWKGGDNVGNYTLDNTL